MSDILAELDAWLATPDWPALDAVSALMQRARNEILELRRELDEAREILDRKHYPDWQGYKP
jgi:hypothetical protein